MSNAIRGLLLMCALGLSGAAGAAEESASLFLKGDPKAGEAKAAVCAACHGAKGVSAVPAWPKLAGQAATYTYAQLKHFKDGSRNNAVMAGQVAALSDQDMQDLAAYYAAQEISPGVASEDAVTKAEKLYRAGDAARGVPACAACHGPNGVGNPASGYPQIGGQHADYTSLQLNAYRAGERKAGTNGQMMASVAAKLTDEDIAALSSYINGLQ